MLEREHFVIGFHRVKVFASNSWRTPIFKDHPCSKAGLHTNAVVLDRGDKWGSMTTCVVTIMPSDARVRPFTESFSPLKVIVSNHCMKHAKTICRGFLFIAFHFLGAHNVVTVKPTHGWQSICISAGLGLIFRP